MSLSEETARSTVWADDDVYAEMSSYLGTHVTIILAGLSLGLFAKLGMGSIDEDDGSVYWEPGLAKKQFLLNFACLQANHEYRMHRMFALTVSEIRQGTLSPLDSGGKISHYEIIGKLVPRKLDGRTAQVRDGSDLAWLTHTTPTAGR